MSTEMADIEDDVDPRVQIELEKLNSATDEINKLEVDLDALQETQQAAVRFERANSAHAAAKEMVFLAEEGLKAEGRTFDHAWQEMLNHATMRVNESELERTLGEAEHRRTSMLYHEAETRVQHMQKDLKRAIAKSRPYFEMKAQSNQQLEAQKARVRTLERQVAQSKLCYARALSNLEKISDEIHQNRRESQQAAMGDLGARVAGVGAESSPARQPIPARQLSNSSGGNFRVSSPTADHETPEFLGLTQLATPSNIDKAESKEGKRGECTEVVAARPWGASSGSSSSERVRELLSQGMMMLNISSLADRISNTPPSSSQGTPARRRSSGSSQSVPSRKVPSPLEKSLLYLSAATEDESCSDSESLASVEMLSDDQVASLMLDRQQEDDLLSETDEEPLLGPACRALASDSTVQAPGASPAKLTPAPIHPLLSTNP
ncbi:hypothetical protein B566_EDAN012515 [Ephemera danica]|nr:hypothetical protein B566_EDAN012515 [Ephemera danica]